MSSVIKSNKTVQQKVNELYLKLAGDKLEKVEETTLKLVAEGKSFNRAMADSLEKHKCYKNQKVDEDEYVN